MPADGDGARAPDRGSMYFAAGMGEMPGHDGWMNDAEAERFRRFVYTKRREEARLGRWTAKHAVAMTLGLSVDTPGLRDVVIRNASDGAPEVFLGDERAAVNISMTDRADWAVCMVTDRLDHSIGCDLELVEPRTARFVADWFTRSERDLVAAEPERHDELANLIWSAKESALKVLRTGLRRDTRSVEVAFGDDEWEGWASLSVTTSEGDRLGGWWKRFGEFVLTCASSGESAPPRSAVDPPPLDAATPSHGWLADPYRG